MHSLPGSGCKYRLIYNKYLPKRSQDRVCLILSDAIAGEFCPSPVLRCLVTCSVLNPSRSSRRKHQKVRFRCRESPRGKQSTPTASNGIISDDHIARLDPGAFEPVFFFQYSRDIVLVLFIFKQDQSEIQLIMSY